MRTVQNKSPFIDLLLLILGSLGIAYGLFFIWDWYSHTQGAAQPPANKVVVVSSPTPDEKPVSSDTSYEVEPDQPRRIVIPAINLNGFIQRVSEDQNKEISTPSNINYAGWFVGSVKPGDSGLSIIDGHVSGRYSTALFANLGSLKKGDVVKVEFGDDSLRQFEVVEKRELPRDETAPYLFKKHNNIDRQLNLITCGGAFDKKSNQYNNRVVIVTKRTD